MSKRFGFTLAEIIIVIGIIGVVATMVIPSMVQGAQDAEYKAGKDKVRMSIAEAGKMLAVDGTITDATTAEDFVKNLLSKNLKISKFCAPADMEQCGMPSGGTKTALKKEDGSTLASMPSTWAGMTTETRVGTGTFPTNSYVFLSGDGIAVNLFYNPDCAYDSKDKTIDGREYYQYSIDTACMAGVYDMNGLKKPNQVGKDIGFFAVFYNNGINSTAVAALPYKESATKTGYESNNYCQGINGYKLPTIDELSALYLGRNLTTIPNVWVWSASGLPGSSSARNLRFSSGSRFWTGRSVSYPVRCVRD